MISVLGIFLVRFGLGILIGGGIGLQALSERDKEIQYLKQSRRG